MILRSEPRFWVTLEGGCPWPVHGPRPGDITEVEEVKATVESTVAFDHSGDLLAGADGWFLL